MELKFTKTHDFYKACILLSAGYKLLEIEDYSSGNFPEKVQPVMTFTPFPDSSLQILEREKYYKVCIRSLYNQLKVKYPLAIFFEFRDDRDGYFISAKKAIPFYRKLPMNEL